MARVHVSNRQGARLISKNLFIVSTGDRERPHEEMFAREGAVGCRVLPARRLNGLGSGFCLGFAFLSDFRFVFERH